MKSVYWMALGILLLATANASADIVDGGDGRVVPEPASFALLATGVW